MTWFLSISLLTTITAPTVRWKKHIKRAGSVRSACQIFIPTVCRGAERLLYKPCIDGDWEKYDKSAAQTALRFLIQSGVVVIPKSTHKIRMIQNIDVFDFVLDEEDMAAIQKLDTKESLFFSHYDPSTVEMLTGLHR